jgi:hypothetical protein
VAGCSPGIPRILISSLFQVTTSRPDPGRKAEADAWRAPVAARVVLAEPVLADAVLADAVLADAVLADAVLADAVLADAGPASAVEAVAMAAAAVIAAAIAFLVFDAPGFFFSLVKFRMSTNTLSRSVGFKRLAVQFEMLSHR